MADRNPAIPIIRTKLHRPPIPRDLVCRKALHDRLETGGRQPLTLVSAPAGYGKSTLVGHWLETRGGSSAWLSLDETDGDLRTFLGYLVAALQTVFPEACAETRVQLEAEALPPLPLLAGRLGNDLDDLEESLVLALDDYHRINEPAVHELVNQLLKHPAGRLQLVVISRYDPPLLLGALRAHNSVTEIRTQDLMFTRSETTAFLKQATGQRVSSTALTRLHRSTEGWVAGLRLATLALRHRSDVDAFLRGFNGDARAVQDYLVEEVLAQQPPAVVDCLCRTSILDRFCAPLCEVVGAAPGDQGGNPLDGSTFIRLLEEAGLFCVALDEREKWYRYHHLFQELLQRQLKAHCAPDKIAGLHRRAASWFEAQGLLEEALPHLLQADGPAEAGRLIVRHRNEILNGEQWHRLNQWLGRLPTQTIGNDPELIMLQAWRLQNHGRYPEAFSMLDRIGEVIDNRLPPPTIERLRGAVHALRCAQKYQEGQGERAVQHSEKALSLLPPDCLSERAYAVVFGSAAHQMCGDLDRAHTLIRGHLADTSLPLGTFQVRLERGQCFMHWVAADLPSLRAAVNLTTD